MAWIPLLTVWWGGSLVERLITVEGRWHVRASVVPTRGFDLQKWVPAHVVGGEPKTALLNKAKNS